MHSLSLKKNSQKSHTVSTKPCQSKASFPTQSFLGQLTPNGSNGASLSIANPKFGSRANSAAGQLHLKSFLG